MRERFPLKRDHSFMMHPKKATTTSGEIPEDDPMLTMAKAVSDLANSRVTAGFITQKEMIIFFTRSNKNVTMASNINVVETETIKDHLLRMKHANNPQFSAIMCKAEDGKEIIFRLPQHNAIDFVIPFNRADIDTVGSLLNNPNLKKLIIIDVDERPIPRQFSADDLFFPEKQAIIQPPPLRTHRASRFFLIFVRPALPPLVRLSLVVCVARMLSLS